MRHARDGQRSISTTVALGLILPFAACSSCGEDPLADVEYALRAAETTLDFGDVPLGAFAERSTFLLNDGTGEIALVDAPAISGSGGEHFVVVDEGSFPLAVESYTELTVRFAPTAEGAATAEVVYVGEVETVRATIALVGRGVAPTVALSPPVVDFGAHEAGLTASGSMTVTNTGDAAVSVTLVIDGRGFRFDDGGNQRTLDLAIGASLEVGLGFAPDRGGPFEGRVIAETCGSLCGPSIDLVGEGIAPRVDVSPRPIAFSEVVVDETATVPVSISNIGVGNLVVHAVTLVDPLGALSLGGFEVPSTLDGAAPLVVEITYAPTAPEGEYTASLLVDTSDPLQPRVSIPITAETPGSRLRMVPSALHFGVVDPGTTREADVALISTGTVAASVDSVDVQGPSFSLVALPPILPTALAPGESITMTIAATGSEAAELAGGATGTLRVFGDDDEPLTTALTFASGNEGCQPRADPGNLALGFVRIGQGANGALVVENVGTGTCTLASAQPRPGLPYDAGFVHAASTTTIAPGSAVPFHFAYQASVAGQASAFVDLAFAEQPAPLLVSATATGVDGSLVAVPPSVSLGPVVVGCSSLDSATVTFINDGASDVTISSFALDPPTTAAVLSAPATPLVIPPGGNQIVTVTPTALSPGLESTTVAATTLELGVVFASVLIETSESGQAVTESFSTPTLDGKVDVLFIVDNSGSMGDDQQILADNFATFIAGASTSGTDFQIGVTSTDVLDPGALRGRLNGSPAILTGQTPGLVNAFETRASLGTNGTGLELGLEAMRLALSEPLASSANAGFHRPAAALSIIVVSDEDDSGDYVGDFGFPEHAFPLESYEGFLDALKGGVLTEAPVLFSAVVQTCCSPRYTDLAARYGGVTLDITSETWGEQLTEIANATFALSRLFRLTTPPQSGTVDVEVDGAPVGFTVDNFGNVVLDDAPPPGSLVEITYVPSC